MLVWKVMMLWCEVWVSSKNRLTLPSLRVTHTKFSLWSSHVSVPRAVDLPVEWMHVMYTKFFIGWGNFTENSWSIRRGRRWEAGWCGWYLVNRRFRDPPGWAKLHTSGQQQSTSLVPRFPSEIFPAEIYALLSCMMAKHLTAYSKSSAFVCRSVL